MAYYNTCPNCGCSLDPGERCDCEDEKEREQKRMQEFSRKYLKMESRTGQLAFAFGGREGDND